MTLSSGILRQIREREYRRLQIEHFKQFLISHTSAFEQRLIAHQEKEKRLEDRSRRHSSRSLIALDALHRRTSTDF